VSSSIGPAVIEHLNRDPVIIVGLNVAGRSTGEVTADIRSRLAGITLPSLGVETVAAAPLPASGVSADGTQALTTFQDATGYHPGNVSIYAGTPTRWTIESTDASTCAVFLAVPRLGIQARLHKGSNTIDLPALQPGTLSYTCSMGMYGGYITVVERPTGASGGAAPGG
jgi:plastocyanin domain-containing protein